MHSAPTCRVFNVHDVEIKDSELIRAILRNGGEVTNESLVASAEAKAASNPKGHGKVTALVALKRSDVEAAYAESADPSQPVRLHGHKLISTVGVTLSQKE